MLIYAIFKTVIGDVLVQGEKNGATLKLLSIQLPEKGKANLKKLLFKDMKKAKPTDFKAVEKAIQETLKGKKHNFPFSEFDLSDVTPFYLKVYKALFKVKPGKCVSYGDLARQVKSPDAVRAVGSCMGKNNFPILIPCHRVIKSDGSLGNFGGGVAMKEKMLGLEGKD